MPGRAPCHCRHPGAAAPASTHLLTHAAAHLRPPRHQARTRASRRSMSASAAHAPPRSGDGRSTRAPSDAIPLAPRRRMHGQLLPLPRPDPWPAPSRRAPVPPQPRPRCPWPPSSSPRRHTSRTTRSAAARASQRRSSDRAPWPLHRVTAPTLSRQNPTTRRCTPLPDQAGPRRPRAK
jgi:hypothetical protein